MKLIIPFLCLLLLFSCKQHNGIPEDILSPQKMEPVLMDYFNAEAYAKELHKKDSLRNDTAENIRLQMMVFKKHNITKDNFYKSFDYYNEHPELMAKVLDSLIAHHSEVEKRIRKRLFFKEYE